MNACCYWSSASCLCSWQTSRSSEHEGPVTFRTNKQNRWVIQNSAGGFYKVSLIYQMRQHEFTRWSVTWTGKSFGVLAWTEPDRSTIWVQIRSKFIGVCEKKNKLCYLKINTNFTMIQADRMMADVCSWLQWFWLINESSQFVLKLVSVSVIWRICFILRWWSERWNRTVVLVIFSPVSKVFCMFSVSYRVFLSFTEHTLILFRRGRSWETTSVSVSRWIQWMN